MSLKYNPSWSSTTNSSEKFWLFYQENRAEFENLLWNACWSFKRKYNTLIEIEDMHTEILLRMHRSDFLNDYDVSKSQFGTFVTGRVYGYAQHFIFNTLKDNFIIEESEDTKSFTKRFENLSGESEEDLPYQRREQLCYNDSGCETYGPLLEKFMEGLNDIKKKIATLYYIEGYSLADVAHMLDIPQSLARYNLYTIRDVFIKHAERIGFMGSKKSAVPATVTPKAKKVKTVVTKAPVSKEAPKKASPEAIKEALAKAGINTSEITQVLEALNGKTAKVPAKEKKVMTKVPKKAISTPPAPEKVKYASQQVKDGIVAVPFIPETSKNGHALAKTRNLTDDEKKVIRKAFVKANGIIGSDATLKIMKSLGGEGLTTFQVVGVINGFHRQVKKGTLNLRDIEAYKAHMQSRRELWATYKSERYYQLARDLKKLKKQQAKVETAKVETVVTEASKEMAVA